MNINRYNYEEYFLLYVDDELNASERKAVEDFVEQNPDLEEELSMLKQSLLKPDTSVVMEDKSMLFKSESSSLITLENYETFFLLYVDEELNAEERRAVEMFVSKNPSLQQELHLLMQTKLQPDQDVVFPDKDLLYRTPATKRTVVVSIYRSVGVAAVILVALGIFWLMPRDNGTTSGPIVAKAEPKKTSTIQKKESTAKTETKSQTAVARQEDVTNSGKKITTVPQTKVDVAKNDNGMNKNQVQVEGTYETPVEKEIRPSTLETTAPILAMNETGSNDFKDATLIVDQPVEQSKTKVAGTLTTVGGGENDPGSTESKSKLRGFFRQVKRVVEKTAHLPGEDKKLQIGNIEIALK